MGKPRSEIQVHNESIKARQVLLEDVLSDIKKYALNEIVIAALKNQGALASLSYKFDLAGQQYAIDSTSLNTLKKKSDELLGHHGFAGLERLRGVAKDAVAAYAGKDSKPTKKTKYGLEQINSELECAVVALRRSNFRLLQGLSAAISGIKETRDGSSEAVRNKSASEAINALLAIVSLNESPFDVIPSHENIQSLKVVRGE
ncbi:MULTISPECIES: hypothetical protein [Pseudomonas]|uniref:Uncharacterized protein n=1 Tax=Pseudomonas veronii TaxID=76761 RepID=A0A5M8EEF8_PSEVE|nr:MULTISPECIES: hypothetical protein [Pseudomonas]AMT86389.1 hypothetical protein AYO71_02155 [Pseudomonas koreensis]KAA6170289.1 hypothetical protein F3K53_28270 [Pseudomonas veronii]KAA6177093.1 hypothetical protein F3K54_12490 [Pseudomonas veronii]KAE9649622.1 hypothetical protein EJD88_23790 [Pseudomonas sp. PB105]MVW98717.1 hypothetical protein [Pseudomonas sp. PB100]